MKIKLVSFAGGPFAPRQVTFKQNAEDSGFFDEIVVHTPDTLPPDFKAEFGPYMAANPRGLGYWIWKSVVVLEELKTLSAEDCLVYMDVGHVLNPGGRKRFSEYVELACDSPYKRLSFSNVYTEAHWTKADLAERLGLSIAHSHMKTSQITANLMLMQNTKDNIDLLQCWGQIAREDGCRYSDDSPSQSPNHCEFQEHRHDQSIFSLLCKLRGTEVTFLETKEYAKAFEAHKSRIPALNKRLRS